MPDADKNFKVRIVTEADGTGVQQTEADLQRLKAEAAGTPSVKLPGGSGAEEALAGVAGIATELGTSLAVAIPAAAAAAYNVLKQITEFQEGLNKQIVEESNALEKASSAWRELAATASNIRDIDRIAGDVSKTLDSLTEKQKTLQTQVITSGQFVQEYFLSILKLSSGLGGIWTPYTDALKEAQIEQGKLAQSAIEAGAAAIRAGEQAKASWEQVKLEPINQAVTEYTAKLKAYMDVQAGVNLLTTDGAAQYKFYQDRIVETTGRLNELTKTQDQLSAASDRVSQEIQKIDFDKLSRPEQFDALLGKLDQIKQKLRELGINASIVNDVLSQAKNLTAADAQEAIKLASAWASVGQAADKAADGASAQVKAILANEDAARAARAQGNDRDADLFEKSAEAYKKGVTPQQQRELDSIRKLRGEPVPGAPAGPLPGGPVAGIGESQDLVNQIEKNRRAFESTKDQHEVGTGGPSLTGDAAEAARKADLEAAKQRGEIGEDAERIRQADLDAAKRRGEIGPDPATPAPQAQPTEKPAQPPPVAQPPPQAHPSALQGSNSGDSILREILTEMRWQTALWR